MEEELLPFKESSLNQRKVPYLAGQSGRMQPHFSISKSRTVKNIIFEMVCNCSIADFQIFNMGWILLAFFQCKGEERFLLLYNFLKNQLLSNTFTLFLKVTIYYSLEFRRIRFPERSFIPAAFCFRKPIVPQKEPSPLLEKKIQQLEAKFAELEGGDEDIEEIGEEESEVAEAPAIPQLQTPLSNELDIMPYTPPQVVLSRSSLD